MLGSDRVRYSNVILREFYRVDCKFVSFTVDLIANKQLSKKDCYSFFVGNNIKYFISTDLSYWCRLWSVRKMTQYLIREFTDSTGHIHTDIEKARTNETLSIVEAEDKEEAKKKVSERNV